MIVIEARYRARKSDIGFEDALVSVVRGTHLDHGHQGLLGRWIMFRVPTLARARSAIERMRWGSLVAYDPKGGGEVVIDRKIGYPPPYSRAKARARRRRAQPQSGARPCPVRRVHRRRTSRRS